MGNGGTWLIVSKLANGAIYCIKALYIVTLTIILAVILFSCSDYFGAKHFRLPNVALLIAGIICIAGMIWTGKYVSRYLSGSIGIRTATIILFFVQVYVAVNILFTTRTWDAWIVYHNAVWHNIETDRAFFLGHGQDGLFM